VEFGSLWQILDFWAKQWIKDIIKCCHQARTSNSGLLHLKVHNNIGGIFPLTSPQPKYWVGCVPGIPIGIDTSEPALAMASLCINARLPYATGLLKKNQNLGRFVLWWSTLWCISASSVQHDNHLKVTVNYIWNNEANNIFRCTCVRNVWL